MQSIRLTVRTGSVSLVLSSCAVWQAPTSTAWAQPAAVTWTDATLDAVARPTDPGASLPFDPDAHHLPDLERITMGRYRPQRPATDLFLGEFNTAGEFFRLDVVLKGLVNPPGSVDPFEFEPFRYGDHPVYGFIEIDMDGDVSTGGELDAPAYRYLGNVVRFGGSVGRPEFRDRVALDKSAFDNDFLTPPFVERHGEEFHVALIGGQFIVREVLGDGDSAFEEGESWIVRGRFFHRAHGFERFSFMEGGLHPGEYAPLSDVQFRHDPFDDVTTLSLVFPLTNVGSGLMRDELAEPSNWDPTDQTSVLEGLHDLWISAAMLPILPTGLPEEAIILNWAKRDPENHLDPTKWRITALLGSSYTSPHPTDLYFLWTDVYPNVMPGDVDGSGSRDGHDVQLIDRHTLERDIDDGLADGAVTILEFAADFSVYDVNHDGRVDAMDRAAVNPDGDLDRDGDVDLADFAPLQGCFGSADVVVPGCSQFNLVPDERLDLADLSAFQRRLNGPGN